MIDQENRSFCINLAKAGKVGDIDVPGLIINASEEVPEFNNLDQARYFYKVQGKTLCDALFKSLPGGTIDSLMCEMMIRKASLFRVPFERAE